jgi:hypothetical protein
MAVCWCRWISLCRKQEEDVSRSSINRPGLTIIIIQVYFLSSTCIDKVSVCFTQRWRNEIFPIKGILRQNNNKNIEMVVCAQITLKLHFLKSQYNIRYKFYLFWVWSLNISIYVERDLDANRITK